MSRRACVHDYDDLHERVMALRETGSPEIMEMALWTPTAEAFGDALEILNRKLNEWSDWACLSKVATIDLKQPPHGDADQHPENQATGDADVKSALAWPQAGLHNGTPEMFTEWREGGECDKRQWRET